MHIASYNTGSLVSTCKLGRAKTTLYHHYDNSSDQPRIGLQSLENQHRDIHLTLNQGPGFVYVSRRARQSPFVGLGKIGGYPSYVFR